jgi:hypothetical protein
VSIDRVLAALEEYFALKRDIGEGDDTILVGARARAAKTLNEYIAMRFDALLKSDKQQVSNMVTRKITIPTEQSLHLEWADIANLIDALNCPPLPPKNTPDKTWVEAYSNWYKTKRLQAINSVSPPEELELNFED